MNGFVGKVVVITGAGGGIGRAAAVRFASEGASVVAVDRDEASLTETVAAVSAVGGRIHTVAGDVTSSTDVQAHVQAAVDAFGGVDVLFNNAGIEGVVSSLETCPEDDFDQVIAVNVKGVWLGMKHTADAMRQRGGGVIINTASVAGLRGTPGLIAYGASKHAVVGMTKSAAGGTGTRWDSGECRVPRPDRDSHDALDRIGSSTR